MYVIVVNVFVARRLALAFRLYVHVASHGFLWIAVFSALACCRLQSRRGCRSLATTTATAAGTRTSLVSALGHFGLSSMPNSRVATAATDRVPPLNQNVACLFSVRIVHPLERFIVVV